MVKFYIYADGRWCEVETRTGRVAGWRERARFCFVRGGRLQAARTAPVLRALQALAAGGRSAVRDAAPLPQQPRRRKHRRSRRASSSRSHFCCAHNHARCDQNANDLVAKPPASLVTPSPVLAQAQKTRTLSSSSGPPEILKQKTASKFKKPNDEDEIKDYVSENVDKKPILQSGKHKVEKLKIKQQRSNKISVEKPDSEWESNDESDERPAQKSPTRHRGPQRKLRRNKKTSSSESDGYVSDRKTKRSPVKSARKLRNSSKVHNISSSESDAEKPTKQGKTLQQSMVSPSRDQERPAPKSPSKQYRSPGQKVPRNRKTASSDSNSSSESDGELSDRKTKRSPVKSSRKLRNRSKVHNISSSESDAEKPAKQGKTLQKSKVSPSRYQERTAPKSPSKQNRGPGQKIPRNKKTASSDSNSSSESDGEISDGKTKRSPVKSSRKLRNRSKDHNISSSESDAEKSAKQGKTLQKSNVSPSRGHERPAPKSPSKQDRGPGQKIPSNKRTASSDSNSSSESDGELSDRKTKRSPVKSSRKLKKRSKVHNISSSESDAEKSAKQGKTLQKSNVSPSRDHERPAPKSPSKQDRGPGQKIPSNKRTASSDSNSSSESDGELSDRKTKRSPVKSSRKLKKRSKVHNISSSESDAEESAKQGKTLQKSKVSPSRDQERPAPKTPSKQDRGPGQKIPRNKRTAFSDSNSSSESDGELSDRKTKRSPVKSSRRLRKNDQVHTISSSESDVEKPAKQGKTLQRKQWMGSRAREKPAQKSPVKQAKGSTKGSKSQKHGGDVAEALVQSLLDISSSEESGKSRERAASAQSHCKELVIEESDVEVLRKFMVRTGGPRDLAKFDNDEDYKRKVFYKLNPLVSIEKCQPLENLLRKEVTLKEFAKNLGLRSVADVTPEKRYRMRRSVRKRPETSDSETDKENKVQPKKRRLWNKDNVIFNNSPSSLSSELHHRKPEVPKPVVVPNDTSDIEAEFQSTSRDPKLKSPVKTKEKSERQSRGRTRSTDSRRRTRSAGEKSFRMLNEKYEPIEDSKEGPGINKAKITRVESPEVVSRKQTRSSVRNAEIPAGTLKEQNEVVSDSDFESSKNSQKKVNDAKKAKVVNKTPFGVASKNVRADRDSGPNKTDMEREKSASNKTDVESRKENKKIQEAATRSMFVKPVKIKKSCVPNGREYSSLEDQAIVAWVSAGGRERLVNGNRVWRQLQEQYYRITGQKRTWHSLRNRYLRYVLPSLGTLALPPSQVSRLRAAAATGELKRQRSRRNSMFAAPAQSSAFAPIRTRARLNDTQPEPEPSTSRQSPRPPKRPPSPRVTRASHGPSSPSKRHKGIWIAD